MKEKKVENVYTYSVIKRKKIRRKDRRREKWLLNMRIKQLMAILEEAENEERIRKAQMYYSYFPNKLNSTAGTYITLVS